MRATLLPSVLLATALALSFAGPLALAQDPVEVLPASLAIEIVPIAGPILPDSGMGTAVVKVTYTAEGPLPTAQPTTVSLAITAIPGGFNAALGTDTLVFAAVTEGCPGCATQSETQETTLVVTATSEAPALTPAEVGLRASASPNTPYQRAEAEAATPVQADLVLRTDARLLNTGKLQKDPKEDEVIPTTIENLGNGPVRFTFEVVSAPLGVRVTPPAAATLESRATGGVRTVDTVTWTVASDERFTPGDIVLRATATYAGNASGVSPAVHDLRVGIELDPKAVGSGDPIGPARFLPASGAVGAAVALGAVAIVSRRTR